MTNQPYRLNVTTSDGKYTVLQFMNGASTALRYGEPWPAYDGKLLSNLELALAYDLEEAREKLVAAEASHDMHEFQAKVRDWCVTCFGTTTADDTTERNWRFLEEALELVQSLGGNAEDAHRLVDYVFDREPGNPGQEVGGTMVTLAALLSANGLAMDACAWKEFDRISTPEMMEKIRGKHARKPHKSPLPGDYVYSDADIAENARASS